MEGSGMMRVRMLPIVFLAGLLAVPWARGDELKPDANPRAEPPTPAAMVADDPRLPPLPYQRLVELGLNPAFKSAGGEGVAEALKVTPEQREKIAKIATAAQQYQTAIIVLRGQFGAGFTTSEKQPLFIAALDRLQADSRSGSLQAMSAVLTAEQRAGLRQRFRREAHEQQPAGLRPVFGAGDPEKINAYNQIGDKLSLLMLVSVQQMLELTDAQYLALRDLRDAAIEDACRILKPEIEAKLAKGASPSAGPSGKLLDPTEDQTLSPEQVKKLEEYVKAQPPEKVVRMFGPSSIKTREVNGQLTVEVKLPNPFDVDPELRKAVGVTDEQLPRIRAAIVKSEERMRQSVIDNHRKTREDTDAGKARLEASGKAFLEQWSGRALALLTPDQIARGDTLQWRANPVMSLLDAGLAKRLELTEEQTTKIRKHLVANRPKPPELPPPGGAGGLEAMNKRNEAFMAQVGAFVEAQRAAVAVLTPAQLAKFIELTGYQAPPPPRKAFQPVRPAPKPGDEV